MTAGRDQQFSVDIARARDLVGLGQSLKQMTLGRVDASDMYRAALVQAVAALDSWVHGIVLDRAVDMLTGASPSIPTSGSRIGLDFAAMAEILDASTAADREIAIRRHLAARLHLETFQRPDDVAKALASVGIAKVWSSGFPDAEAAKIAVGLVVARRNQIVHSCDVDPLTTGAVVPLSDEDALQSIDTVEYTVTQIALLL